MAGRRKPKLDARKSIFISEILTGKSGAEAARAAGIESKNAARQANRWQSDAAVAGEIERGLAAIREGAEVTAETMIRQLDADRQFAIKTENASAATRASELKAKLCGLMIDRKDVRAAHIVRNASVEHSTRNVALAINALLQDSDLTVTRVSDALPAVPVSAHGEVSGTPVLDASFSQDLPDTLDSSSEKIGVQIPIGNKGAKIVPIITEGGQRKYAVRDFADELHSFKFDRLDAEELARTLPGIPERGS